MSVAIFDLDGTLFDPAPLTVRAAHRALDAYGLPLLPAEEITKGIGHRGDSWYRGLVEGLTDDAALVDAVMEHFHGQELDLVESGGRLFDGIPDMLDAVEGVVDALALCTNGYPDYVATVLRTTGLDGRFAAIRAGGGGTVGKPALVADLLVEVRTRRGVVVGDRVHDMDAARTNGLGGIGAGWGYAVGSDLDGADVVAAEPSAVADLVVSLLGAPGPVG